MIETSLRNRSLWAGFGAVLTGFLASLCCLGPLLLAGLGLGSVSAFVFFESYRTLFLLATLALLGLGFYGRYQQTRSSCDCESGPRRPTRGLWFMGSLALVLAGAPLLLSVLPALAQSPNPAPATGEQSHVTLLIEGMSCSGCAGGIADQLKQLKGVTDATVSFEKKTAEVTYDKNQIKPQDLIDAIKKLGYTASEQGK